MLENIFKIYISTLNIFSNEFKESALTLACYKGHLEMVRFLLEAGADQEHKVMIHCYLLVLNCNIILILIIIVQTDEMHTALMEASMDGHVEVARLLLDSGAQVRKYLNHHKNIWLLCELLSGDSVQCCSAPRHAKARVSICAMILSEEETILSIYHFSFAGHEQIVFPCSFVTEPV